MIKNKTSLSVRWLGVFSTVKSLIQYKLLRPYDRINFVGELRIRGNKLVQIKCCNKDTRLSKSHKYLCFFDKIQPDKFDYLVCVYMDKYSNIHGHYIFTRSEVMEFFPDMKDASSCKGLYIPLKEHLPEPLESLVDNSFENWNKLRTS